MCQEMERCAFYNRYRHERKEPMRKLVRTYCENKGAKNNCRRLLISQFYDVNLASFIGPAGDFLDPC